VSNGKTLGYGEDWRLFQEEHEKDRVWVSLRGCSLRTSLQIGGASLDGNQDPKLLLGIEVGTWRKLVESWNRSEWASSPEQDHKPAEFELEDFFQS
jgi:hypothetical protein